MTSTTSHSVFRNAALASGLLSQQQLDDALNGLSKEAAKAGGVAVEPIGDEPLGQRLVDLGYLNRWQVEQLKEGRTKFTLGPYRIVNAIGQGGMGHVFKAEHKLLGRIEAIKVLPKIKSTPDSVAAFQREIRAQAQLDHPNLVRVTYADYEGDTYFFVTEYVPGTDLRKLVRRNGPLPYPTAATIIAQAAEGLHYAHRRGLVHRDVKPGNLLVTPDGRTKITDLGLAWFLMEELEGGKLTAGRTKSLVGTADYLAPEAIRQPDKILPVSDIYALGCTLYYAVTGKVPFPGGNTPDKIRRHLDETPLNPLHFNPDLPEGFCDAIAAMMDKNPDTRTPTAAAVVELLRPWCDEAAIRHLAESSPASSGIFKRGGAPAPPAAGQMDETASFVLDDGEFGPGQVESPSQISQGTVSVASELEDTLAGVSGVRRVPVARPVSVPVVQPTVRRRWPKLLGIVLLIAAAAALVACWSRFF
ncbi:MAG TPA: serine/threonine-protein kinase [Lacipirellulaceae bacterium]|jgi:serine/threonine protein kinase|nr:serine/threonine-protein kinase [Lacipirellulaceae bacterium]